MISLSRIGTPSMGFNRPSLGQDGSFTPGPIGAGLTPPAAPAPEILPPGYYNFPVQEVPVPVPVPAASTPLPTWAIIGLSAIAGAVVAGIFFRS